MSSSTEDDRHTGEKSQLDELLTLAHDRSVQSRTRLVQTVGDLFFNTELVLSERERVLMTEILRQLIHDVEMSVRRLLAQRLAGEPSAPPDLIRTLANDTIEVAHPILLESSVLQDLELIEIIQHRTLRHQLAIAMRKSVSEEVSDALVETGNADVIKQLLENSNADISQKAMEYLVEESQRIDTYQNPLVNRQELSSEMARRMYLWVSGALRHHILDSFDLDPVELEEVIQESAVSAMSQGQVDDSPMRKATELAQRLARDQSITPDLLVDTLRQGEVTLFEDMFAQFTGLRTDLLRRFIYEPGAEALAIACRATGITKPQFASIFLLSRSARPGDKNVDPDEVDGVMRLFDRIRPETAEKMLKRWRLDPDFLEAIKRTNPKANSPPTADS